MMHYWRTVPPLKAMLAVEAVARLRSFTRAGEELNTSQSAVSHAVSLAESFLETRIFDRSARPVALTEAGIEYVTTLSACLAQLSAETTAMRSRKAGNILTISCNLAYGNFWLLPNLKAFQEAYPGIQVNMVTTYQGLASLDPGIDVAIRFGRGNWPGARHRLLFREQILPVASPGYAARSAPVSTPQDLLQHTLLHAYSIDPSWYDWTQWFEHFGIRPGKPLPGPTFDNHLIMMQAAISGRGVALGWIGTATDFLREGQLVPMLDRPIALEEGLYVVTGHQRNEQADAFVAWICDLAGGPFETLAGRFWHRHI